MPQLLTEPRNRAGTLLVDYPADPAALVTIALALTQPLLWVDAIAAVVARIALAWARSRTRDRVSCPNSS